MGGNRDFLLSSLFDGLAPLARRPLEDLVYEILDHRKTPNHTEFQEFQARVELLAARNLLLEERIEKLERRHTEELAELRQSLRGVASATVEAAMVAVEQRDSSARRATKVKKPS